MGFAISWLAVRGKAPEAAFQELGVSSTGAHAEIPESAINAAPLPDDWHLLFINEFGSPYVSDNRLHVLSRNCEVVACVVEEHVMFSRAQYWKDGRRLWEITHEAQDNILNLTVDGEPPPRFEAVRETAMQAQMAEGVANAEVDFIFDVPLILAKELTGFKHDEANAAYAGANFTVLSPTAGARPGFDAGC